MFASEKESAADLNSQQPAPQIHRSYPFQGLALRQQQPLFPTDFKNMFAPKTCDQNQPISGEGSQSKIDDLICNFCVRSFIRQQRQYWNGFDDRAAKEITQFKQNYILGMGDVRVRSVVMAVASASFYKLISFRTSSIVGRTRNLAVSFGLMGLVFVPELFNPFLVIKKQK